MQKLTTIKLETVFKGIVISCFKATIPEFFTAAGHQVVKVNESHWLRVLTWAAWEEPNTGCKMTLTDHSQCVQRVSQGSD
jgi:hypothetical protein